MDIFTSWRILSSPQDETKYKDKDSISRMLCNKQRYYTVQQLIAQLRKRAVKRLKLSS